MEKIIEVDGQQRRIVANALLPKKYRHQFGRDLVADMKKMADAQEKGDTYEMDVLERLTWLMLREGGEDVGETPDEWLASLDTVFALYEALPAVVDLWVRNTKTTSISKKK